MFARGKKIIVKTAAMQESVTYLIHVPVIASFIFSIFDITGGKLILIVSLTALSGSLAFVAGMVLKYKLLHPVVELLQAIETGRIDPVEAARAKRRLFSTPIVESLFTLFRWFVFNNLIIMIPLAVTNQITFIQTLSGEFILLLTGLLSMPVYYFTCEMECAAILKIEQVSSIVIDKKRQIRVNVFQKLLITILFTAGYPLAVLIYTIFLAINKYIDLAASQMVLVTLSVATFSTIIIVVYLVSKNLTGTIKDISARFAEIGRGNLTQSLPIASDDELGDMAKSFNEFLANLNSTISSVKVTAMKLADSIDVISGASSSLADNSQVQANNAASVFSSMEQYGSSIRTSREDINKLSSWINGTTGSIGELSNGFASISQNTREMLETVKTNHSNAIEGKEKITLSVDEMFKTSENMLEIAAQVESVGRNMENIDEILNVISEIAEQTNLLAMNASIEAAHAGESGKGFAVVADEIRKLAESSKDSVEEINKIVSVIKAGVENAVRKSETGKARSEEGKKRAIESGNSLEGIMNSISVIAHAVESINEISGKQQKETSVVADNANRLNDFFKRIKASIEEQSGAQGAIIDSMNWINKATGENASSSESLFRLSETLKSESERLRIAVRQFKLKD